MIEFSYSYGYSFLSVYRCRISYVDRIIGSADKNAQFALFWKRESMPYINPVIFTLYVNFYRAAATCRIDYLVGPDVFFNHPTSYQLLVFAAQTTPP